MVTRQDANGNTWRKASDGQWYEYTPKPNDIVANQSDNLYIPKQKDLSAVPPRGRNAASSYNNREMIEANRVNTDFTQQQINELRDIEKQGFGEQTKNYFLKRATDLLRGTGQILDAMPGRPSAGELRTILRTGAPETKSERQARHENENYVERIKNMPIESGTTGLAKMASEAPLYMATGVPNRLFGKGAIKLADSVLATPGAIRRSGALGKASKEFAMAPKTPRPVPNYETQLGMEHVLGAPTTGLLEHAIDPESNSALASIMSSTLGVLPGVRATDIPIVTPLMSKVPIAKHIPVVGKPFDFRKLQRSSMKPDEQAQTAIDWYQSKGGNPSSGLKSGSMDKMAKEATLRNNPNFYQSIKRQIDDPNNVVDANIIADSIGMPRVETPYYKREDLVGHKEALGKRMDELVANTSGVIKRSEIAALRQRVRNIAKKPDGTDNKTAINSILNKLKRAQSESRQGRNARGQATHNQINGATYQNLRSDLKEMQRSMLEKGHRKDAKIVTDLIDVFDNSIEKGVANRYGSATAKEWKDVNEKYALTQLIMDQGLDSNGRVLSGKLTNYLENTDLERMLLGTDGAIKDIHNLVKYHKIAAEHPNPGLAGRRAQSDSGSTTIDADQPIDYSTDLIMDPLTDFRLKVNFSDWPARSGILGLPEAKAFNPDGTVKRISKVGLDSNSPLYSVASLSRGIAQSGDLYPHIYEKGSEAYNSLMDFKNDPLANTKEALRWFKSLMEDEEN